MMAVQMKYNSIRKKKDEIQFMEERKSAGTQAVNIKTEEPI